MVSQVNSVIEEIPKMSNMITSEKDTKMTKGVNEFSQISEFAGNKNIENPQS